MDKKGLSDDMYQYNCNVKYSEPLYYFQFYEYEGKIEWEKNQRIWKTSDSDIDDMTYIGINIKKEYIKENGFPKVYKGKMELGKLFLFAEYDGKNIYLLFLNKNVVKTDKKREHIWRIKKQYVNSENEDILNEIMVHKKGVIDLHKTIHNAVTGIDDRQ